MKWEVCPKGKVAHPTREAALDHQKALVYKNYLAGESERSKGLNVYPCQHCAYWHVGHSEGPKMPLVYHYTIGKYLDRILEADALKPRNSRKLSLAINEPNPLLWFSWNAYWDHSVLKDPRPRDYRMSPPTGRAVTELAGQGLIRFGAPASVAKLRWNDYLDLNTTPFLQREAMAQRGHPPDWLATDQPVSLSDCKAFEVWYRGAWVQGDSMPEGDFDAYLAGREAAYDAAWDRLRDKVLEAGNWEAVQELVLDDDAEVILFEDLMVAQRVAEWRHDHAAEIQQFQSTVRRRGGRVRR